jgi:nucleotide-binding universal stress UspA family protein
MLKRVLVPLDGSRLAQMALDFATNIVDTQCEIVLLTAIQKPEIPIFSVNPMIIAELDYADIDFMRKDAQSNLESVAKNLNNQGLHSTSQVEVGDPATIIVQVARLLDVDMIIMSTHGRSGVSRWLFGSVTGRVLSMAPCPVLVVPSYARREKFEHEIAEMRFG